MIVMIKDSIYSQLLAAVPTQSRAALLAQTSVTHHFNVVCLIELLHGCSVGCPVGMTICCIAVTRCKLDQYLK